jgi:hypothetical protein
MRGILTSRLDRPASTLVIPYFNRNSIVLGCHGDFLIEKAFLIPPFFDFETFPFSVSFIKTILNCD